MLPVNGQHCSGPDHPGPAGLRDRPTLMGAVPVDPGPGRFQAKPHKTLKEAGSRKLSIFDSVPSKECFISNNDTCVARKATLSSWPASRRRGYGMTDKTDDILASDEASSGSRCSRTCHTVQECFINNNDASLTEQHYVTRKATLSSWPASRRRSHGMTDKTDESTLLASRPRVARGAHALAMMQPESESCKS